MNKSDLVENVSQALTMPYTTALKVVDRFLYEINHALIDHKDIIIHNFGVFKVVKAKARMARNPRENKTIQVPAKFRVRFSISKNVLERVRKK